MLAAACNRTSSPFDKSEWDKHDQDISERSVRMRKIADQIKGAQGLGNCKTSDHCRVVGLGAKLCGGFNNFLIYSIEDTKEVPLRALVNEFNQEAEEMNRTSLNIGRCGVGAGAVSCIEGRCQVPTP